MVDAGWTLERYGQTSFVGGGHFGINRLHDRTVVSLGVRSSARVNFLDSTTWNDISSNVEILPFSVDARESMLSAETGEDMHIYPMHPRWPRPYRNSFPVVVEEWNFVRIPPTGFGQDVGIFMPDGTTVVDSSFLHDQDPTRDWIWGTIKLCDRSTGSVGSGINRSALFVHEVGHALKLNDIGWFRTGLYPTRHSYHWHPVSVMNVGTLGTHEYMLSAPSGYDRFNLIRHWGR